MMDDHWVVQRAVHSVGWKAANWVGWMVVLKAVYWDM
jgi:hypothetical protein